MENIPVSNDRRCQNLFPLKAGKLTPLIRMKDHF